MSSPIAFTPTPKDALNDNADAQDYWGQVATTTDANFEKINAWWRGNVPKVYRSLYNSSPASYALNAYTDYPNANWAALTVPIPTAVSVVLIFCGASVNYTGPVGTWFTTACRVSGATSFVIASEATRVMAYGDNRQVHTPMTAIPAAQLTPGGNLVITPQYFNATGSATALGSSVSAGHLSAIVLT